MISYLLKFWFFVNMYQTLELEKKVELMVENVTILSL